QSLPPGAMLAVLLPEDRLREAIPRELAIAAVNGPGMCVVAGPRQAVTRLRAELAARGARSHLLHVSHALHSPMMEPVLADLRSALRSVALGPPRIPYVTNLTGTWATDRETTSPEHWARHLCAPVRFADGLGTLLQTADPILLEVGPGEALSTLARR